MIVDSFKYTQNPRVPPIPQPTSAPRAEVVRAALGYAAKGIPVFPLSGKKPRTSHGFYDARFDPSRITALWNRYPDANIGIPTGSLSGLVVVDRDGDSAEAARIWVSLPPTLEVSTSRGRHRYYRVPKGTKVKSRKLAPDLDLKADGGYVVAPPSVHPSGARYEVVEETKAIGIAMLPDEMVVEPEPSEPRHLGYRRREGLTVGLNDGGPIPEGTRNETLASICGRLHDGSRDAAQLAADLAAINEAQCEPPLPAGEVEKIAASIHKTEPCKPAAPEMTPETLEALDLVEAVLWRRDWPGTGGKSERDVYAALIVAARRCGTLIPAGVRVSIDMRSLALAAAVSKRALLDSRKNGERKPGILNRLKRRGLIRSDNANRGRAEAGAFVLLTPRAEFHHSPTGRGYIEPGVTCGETLRAPRLRWSAPETKRLGKTRGALIDALQRAGGTLTVAELAAAGGIKRGRDLRRRLLPDLEAAGVVECSGDTVSLTEDWTIALDQAREIGGEIAALRRDMVRYNLQRAAYADRHKVKPGRVPSEHEMREYRESYPERRRQNIEEAIARLFAERLEYRSRRVGQICCALARYLPDDFPRGEGGLPKDHEVEAILAGEAA